MIFLFVILIINIVMLVVMPTIGGQLKAKKNHQFGKDISTTLIQNLANIHYLTPQCFKFP